MTEKLWNSNYLKIWTGNFLLNFSFTLIVPLLPLYLSETFGAGNDTIGMALAGYIPEWEARLDRDATPDEKEGFESLSGIDIPENMNSRREILEYIYERL